MRVTVAGATATANPSKSQEPRLAHRLREEIERTSSFEFAPIDRYE
jgi:hypothetical protein